MAITQLRANKQIKSETLENLQVATSAGIELSKLESSSYFDYNIGNNRIEIGGDLEFTSSSTKIVGDGTFKITGLAAGIADTDAVNVGQLNAVATAGKAWKEVVFHEAQLINGVKADLLVDCTNALSDVTYTAVTAGNAGNDITVVYVVAGTSTPLTIDVTANAITVNVETDGGDLPISTAIEVAAAINADDDANDLVTAAEEGAGSGVVEAKTVANLAGGTGGVAGAQILQLSANLVAGDTITVNDGTNTDVLIADTDFTIGGDINATLVALETAIDGGTAVLSAVATLLDSIDPTNNVLVLYETTAIGDPARVYGNAAAATRVSIVNIAHADLADNAYEGATDHLVALPTSDPAATNFGFARAVVGLTANETHLSRENDSAYTWDSDGEIWNMTGASSIPYASTSTHGKVKVGDGIAVADGVVSATISTDLTTNGGIIFAGSSPDKTIGLNVDGSSVELSSGVLGIVAGGVDNAHLANSTITVSGDSGTDAVALGETLTFDGNSTQGVSCAVTSNQVAVTVASATTSTLGVASFATADFGVTAGAVSLSDAAVKSAGSDSGTATPTGHTLNIVGGDGIDTSGSGDTITITGEEATTSNKGIAAFSAGDFTVGSGTVFLVDSALKQVYTDSGNTTGTNHRVEILGGEGIDTSGSGNVITITGEDATDSNKGIASFDNTDFVASSGVITLHASVPQTVTGDSGTATPASSTFQIAGGEGIDTSGSGATLTISGEDASTSNKGIASFSSSHFGVASGVVTIAADAIDETLMDWGSSAGQVDATSMPLDSGGSYAGAAANVQDALEELEASGNENWKTFSVSGQSDVVADSSEDTLTFVAGTDITITTNATTDTITITSSGSSSLTASLGVERSGDNFQIDILSGGGLGLTGNEIGIAADGVNETFIDWGSGASQVDATSLPIDSGGSYAGSATNTQDALEELEATQAAKYVFKTIAVSGQSDVVADAVADTLTLVAGTDISITTNAGTDTITINGTDGASDLTASLGVERSGDNFQADLLASGGLKLTGNEIGVEPNDFAGTGLEDDGADNMRLATQGNGIAGGNGSTLSVNLDGSTLAVSASGVKLGPLDAVQFFMSTGAASTPVAVDMNTRETPTGDINGVNTSYALANTPVTGTESVFLNGILQEDGGEDYSISGGTITMTNAPIGGGTPDRLRVSYISAA